MRHECYFYINLVTKIIQQLQRNFRTLYTFASGPEQPPEHPKCQVYLKVDLSNIVG